MADCWLSSFYFPSLEIVLLSISPFLIKKYYTSELYSVIDCLFLCLSLVYDITILTSDKQQAGTTQNASLMLEGENGSSKQLIIENSASKKVLRRGEADSFNMRSKQLGQLSHVILSHVMKRGANVKGTGKDTGWFVHEVIVENEDTGK